MEYNQVELRLKQYSEKCKQIIKNTFFKEEDLQGIILNQNLGLQETIRKHRLKMIDIKLDHTMRMIDQIVRINEQLGLKFDFKLVMQIAILYHDVGRFSQSTWSNIFSDSVYKAQNKPFANHGEEGQHIFFTNDFAVDPQVVPIIGESIRHHVNPNAAPHLQHRFNSNLSKININDIATGKMQLNEAECQVASLITQLVADIDKVDILYQHLLDDFDMIRDYVVDNSYDTLDNVARYWGVSKQEIIEYNQIDVATYKPRKIRVPIKNMNLSKLQVPEHMREMFYNNTWPELKELQQERNWHFITILWWRLSLFLHDINFYPVLITIEESKLLEKMEKKVPANLKPLVQEAFDYAKEVLVHEKLQKSEGNLYLR